VGFCGVGRMGFAMALNLLKAGLNVVVTDKNPDAVAALMKQGAHAVPTPAELGAVPGLSAVFSMLPSPAAIREA
jgi:3-hydroxyisobutyrate dehydrogenase-like beta-hydroxyacid dehydrogenase